MTTANLSRQNSILNDIIGLNIKNSELSELCTEIVDIIGRADFVDIHSLYVVENQKNKNVIKFHGKSGHPMRDIDSLNEITSKLFNIRSPLFYNHISDLKLPGNESMDSDDLGSLFSIPVAYNDKLMGVIHLSSLPGSTFTVEQMSFLLFLAYIITTTLMQHPFFSGLKIDPELLPERKMKCRFIIENDFELIMEASTDGKFIYVNDKHEEILGFKANELIGANIFKYIHPDDVAEVIRVFSRGMGTLSSEYVRFRYRNNKGYWLWLESMGNPYINSKGEVRAIVASRKIEEHTDRTNYSL